MSFSMGREREEDKDMPNARVGGDKPRMILVRLNSEDAHFMPTYAWLIEEGRSVQFNSSVHSVHGNGQRVIWFEEGGPAPVIEPMQDPTPAPMNELNIEMQPQGPQVNALVAMRNPSIQRPIIAPSALMRHPIFGPVNAPNPSVQQPIIAPTMQPLIIASVTQPHQTMQRLEILPDIEPNIEVRPLVNVLVDVLNPQRQPNPIIIPIDEPNPPLLPHQNLGILHNEPNPPMQAASFLDKTIPYFLQVFLLLVMYLMVGIGLYFLMMDFDGITGADKKSLIDPVYFLMVILSTTGYGDIHPDSTAARLCTSFLILFGCGLLAGRLTTLFECLSNGFSNVAFGYMTQRLGQPISERSREKLKVGFAILVIILCIGVGIIGGAIEGMGFLDSLCFSVVSVTSVGFGDQHFTSRIGKVFAIFWLPVSTTLVAISFAHIAKCGYGLQ